MRNRIPPNRLRELRIKRELLLAALAEDMSVAVSTVSRWETSDTAIPDYRKQELAEYFGVTVSWLMCWDDGNGNGEGERAAA